MGDTTAATKPIRRKPMMAQAADRASGPDETPMRNADGSVRDWFKLRTGYQQFMRENEPLFRVLASSSDEPLTTLEAGGMAAAAGVARAVAVAAARALTGKAEPSTAEIRPFRTAAAEIAAAAWRDGRLERLDPAAVAAELASVGRLVDENLDRSVFREGAISDEASLNMTAMGVTLRLMEPVMTYDFRRDRAALVSSMSTAVMSFAAEAARDVLPEGAKADDRRSVVQTLCSCLSSVMAQVYERKAKHYVAYVVTMPEDAREAFARRYDPMPEIVKAFRENAKVYAAASYASSRAAMEAALQSPPGDPSQPR